MVPVETARRFLALAPVAFGITAVVLVYLQTSGDIAWDGAVFGLVSALVVTVGALGSIVAAAALLRLLEVRNDWASLAVGLVLATVVLAVAYFVVASTLPEGDEGWSLLYVLGPAFASIPVWPGFAVALLIRGWRGRAARQAPPSGPAAPRLGP